MISFSFLSDYRFVIACYAILALIIFLNRKKFQVENKFILLYKTKYGIDAINKFAEKNKEFVKIVGYSAIGIGFVGMLTICGFLVKGLYDLLFVPSAPPTMSLVIPGVQIPGSPIFVPFWYGIMALFIVVVFHEFGHGIVAKAHGIKIKSTGIVFFGPLVGAFVEPDEKQLVKYPSPTQNSIFGAGPFFNVILAAVAFLVLMLILNPLMSTMVYHDGIMFNSIQAGYPAEKYGLQANVAYNELNGVNITGSDDFVNRLSCIKPNEQLVLKNSNSTINILTVASPADKTKGYIGVAGIKTNYQIKSENVLYQSAYYLLYFLTTLLQWVFMLSLGIGLANLMPLGPVDGGRMLGISLNDTLGKEKGTKWLVKISIAVFVTVLILIFIPIIKSVLFKA